jgi:hypothetical protein
LGSIALQVMSPEDRSAASARPVTVAEGSGRSRRAREEALRDGEWLAWLARFRFVTARELGLRFGVSERQARVRLGHLHRAGVVDLQRSHIAEAFAASVTTLGRRQLGDPRPAKRPRADVQRLHELAVVALAAQLELALPDITVRTERDGQRLEAETKQRYSVDIDDGHGRSAKRWPDLMIETANGNIAIEIEFSPKGSSRLRAILAGYLASDLSEVRIYVASVPLARRILRLDHEERTRLLSGLDDRLCRVRVLPWDGASEEAKKAIRDAAASTTQLRLAA